jgi:poly(A) polymerase
MADRLAIVSAERIRDEFSKLLVGEFPARGLRGLVKSGLAAVFLPELVALSEQHDPFHRHKDVWEHTLAVVEKTDPRLRIRMAALLHDIGKPDTREFAQGGVTFHHHEVVGARMARRRLRELRYPKTLVDEVGQLVFLHLRPHTFKMGWTDSAVRRYARDAGELLEDLNQLVRSDVTTANPKRAALISRRIDELEERIAVLAEAEELDKLRAPIDGNDVMKYLGIGPGKDVGMIMKMLLEYRIDHGPYDPDEAYALVDAWVGEHGANRP